MILAEKLKYLSYDDLAKLEYGRLLWKSARGKTLLLNHWLHPEHPHRERFIEFQPIIERVLSADPKNDEYLDQELEKEGWSLRAALREIPPIIGRIPFR
jgi:hypothetical protein